MPTSLMSAHQHYRLHRVGITARILHAVQHRVVYNVDLKYIPCKKVAVSNIQVAFVYLGCIYIFNTCVMK